MLLRITKKQRAEYEASLASMTRKRSQFGDTMRRLFRNKLSVIGLSIIIILLILIIFAGVFTKYPYDKQDFMNRFAYPSAEHIFGTDDYGRDIFARILYGGRISMLVAVVAVLVSLTSGIVLGATAGYFGGKTDLIISRILDVVMAIPPLLLAIAISAALGSGPIKTAIAVSIGTIPSASRIVRSTVLSIKEQEFIEAARMTGSSNARIIFTHILPNILSPVIVDATLRIGGCILAISGLSFIGLGVQPPIPEWGSILAVGRKYIRDFWPLTAFPAIVIALTLFGFNLFGDGLRDALDPKLKN